MDVEDGVLKLSDHDHSENGQLAKIDKSSTWQTSRREVNGTSLFDVFQKYFYLKTLAAWFCLQRAPHYTCYKVKDADDVVTKFSTNPKF